MPSSFDRPVHCAFIHFAGFWDKYSRSLYYGPSYWGFLYGTTTTSANILPPGDKKKNVRQLFNFKFISDKFITEVLDPLFIQPVNSCSSWMRLNVQYWRWKHWMLPEVLVADLGGRLQESVCYPALWAGWQNFAIKVHHSQWKTCQIDL